MRKLLLLTLLLVSNISISAEDSNNENIILVISSYNPDTQRMSSFINDFENEIVKVGGNYRVMIEDMACKNVSEYPLWKDVLINILKKYKRQNVKSVILLGQEAFSTYVSLSDSLANKIPFFGCFASENGIDIYNGVDTYTVNMVERSKLKGVSGGFLNKYDIAKNIDLIQSLYPNTQNIAFVSDNTYGGISLRSLVKDAMAKYPKLNLINIDSRFVDQYNISDVVNQLPENTAMLIGTWRVDRNGVYMMNNALKNLIPLNRKLPTFTITGTGLGTIAIGGYVPQYKISGKEIADQIHEYYTQGKFPEFTLGDGEYRFDRDMLNDFDIRESHLPSKSVIVDSSVLVLKKYRSYIYISLFVIAILIILMTWLYKIYRKNKALQVELLLAKNQAEESDKLKTAFLANMGHEIRTPLNSIVGFANLLCEEPFPEESKDEYCNIITSNSQMLLTLMNDILDISRMEAGKLKFNYSDEETVAICEQTIFTTQHLQKNGVPIIFMPDNKNVIIHTDLQRISQILINLVSNAIKFTEKGTITLSYEIKHQQKSVWFAVTDTGCGIPKELQSKVFNRFEKLNNFKQGTGLGLAICKQLATHLGGDVWIDAEYTSGTRFIFSHPIKDSEALSL